MLELVEAAFDEVALAVELGIDGSLHPACAQGGDVGSGSMCLDQFDDGAGVVTTIGNHVAAKAQTLDQVGHGGLVGRLAGREHHAHRQPAFINDGIDLGAQSATRTADGVIRAPFLPPPAC